MITLKILRTVPLLTSLTEPDLREVVAAAADVYLTAGEWLVQEGEPAAFL